MEKKILRELQNITKELKVIGKNVNKDKVHYIEQFAEPLKPFLDVEQLEKISNTGKEKELTYDTDEAVDFIQKKFKEEGKTEVTREVIRKMIDFDEDYMRSVGIIED